jgi:protein TonB
MSKIDLTSKEWCELVFEGKNKEYGAYELRQSSTKRHYWALIIVLALSVVLFSLPTLIDIVTPMEDHLVVTEVTTLSDLQEPDEMQEEAQKIEAPPPPPLKSAIKFTAPVITKAEIHEDDEIKTQDEVTKSKAEVSFTTIEGDDDNPNAESISDQLNQIANQQTEDKPYEIVEQMPQYPGGEKAMREFIAKNLRYPTVAQEGGIEGRVFVRFIISKTGEVSNVEVMRSVHPLCDKEAVRVIQLMPKWIPGKNNGNAVSVIYSVPIVFKLVK